MRGVGYVLCNGKCSNRLLISRMTLNISNNKYTHIPQQKSKQGINFLREIDYLKKLEMCS